MAERPNDLFIRSMRRFVVLAICVSLLSACNTTPKKPPPPKPVAQPTQPPPPPPGTVEQEHSNQQMSGSPEQNLGQSSDPTQGRQQSARQEQFASPSADAAEVEIEEYAVDESGNRIQTQAGADSQSGREDEGRSGGAAMPAGPAAETRGGREMLSGVVVLGPDAPAATSDLVGPNMQIGAQTQDEQLAALDAELDAGLSAFDERMRRARKAAEAERDSATGGGGASYGEVDGRGRRVDIPETRGAGGGADRGSGLGNTPDYSGEAASGNQQVSALITPPDLPDGRDDDIVARQLREAASKETDPILREKLWEEYRKYKAGL